MRVAWKTLQNSYRQRKLRRSTFYRKYSANPNHLLATTISATAFRDLRRQLCRRCQCRFHLGTSRHFVRFGFTQVVTNRIKIIPFRGMPNTVISDLDKALGQNMLEKPANEFNPRYCRAFPDFFVAVFIPKRHLSVIDPLDSAVGDGNPAGISTQIIDDILLTICSNFAPDTPLFIPRFTGNFVIQIGALHALMK